MSDPLLLDQTYLQVNYIDVGFKSLLNDVLVIFRNQASLYLSEIRSALDEHDTVKLAEVAHALKGSAGSVGAAAVANLAHTIEKLAKTQDTSTIASQITDLGRLVDQTIIAISAELERLQAEDELNLLL